MGIAAAGASAGVPCSVHIVWRDHFGLDIQRIIPERAKTVDSHEGAEAFPVNSKSPVMGYGVVVGPLCVSELLLKTQPERAG